VTTPDTATPDLGSFGAWTFPPNASYCDFGPRVTPGQAREIERLGYGTLWVTGSPPAELSFAEPFLESTTELKVATGVVNIWSADAKTVAESFHRINTTYPGRFVLGIGAAIPSPWDCSVAWAMSQASPIPLSMSSCCPAALSCR